MAKEKSLTVGNTMVTICEENGVVQVKIVSSDAVIQMNDEIIYSIGNDREEYKRIPPKFHSFILENGVEYIEYDDKKKISTVDTYPNGDCLTFYFPTNLHKDIHARFDFITSVEEVKDYLLGVEDEENLQNVFQELEERFQAVRNFVESKGYKMVLSHDMGEWFYAWWDIVFQAKDWNEESIREIMKEVQDFNQFINRLRDQYHR